MKPEFVHLHNHSEYSLLDGVIRISDRGGKQPSELIRGLAAQGSKGFALTDHGNMYGAVEFYLQCSKVGLKPIVGCELYMSKGSHTDRGHSQKDNCHITVLARNFEGYQNLMQLSSKAFLEGFYYDPRIDKELLAEHSKGLIVLSGCLKSEINQAIVAGNLAGAEKLVGEYRDILEPGSFFLELMDHGIDKQRQVKNAILEIHKRMGLPLVATNDSHYPKKKDADAHDARVCIATGRRLEDTNRLKFDSHEFYVKSAEEMAQLFSYAPEAITNTLKIAEMCSLEIPMNQSLLPEFEVPEGFTQDSYLEKLCVDGLEDRLGGTPPNYNDRLRYELGVIKRMGFSGYFLVVWDFIAYARREAIPVGPGRGSGAGAIVAFALRITNIDPIKHNLLFERFLNPDRKSMPDLDIDFADTGRDRVIEYVRGKYGAANVAQIITFGSLGPKLVVRDVGRVMGIPLSDVDRIAKMIPGGPDVTLYKSMQSPEMTLAAKDPRIKKLLDLSLKLEGLKRHTGVHAAGTVITKEAVSRYTPLAKGRNDVITTQYDGKTLPQLGLLKVDFLGLRTLSVIDEATHLIRARGKDDFDIDKIPEDDKKTFDLLCTGKALAIFQLDSSGIRDLVYRIKPTDFNAIVSLIALYRPGPMKSGMLDTFVDCKHGKKKISYAHKLLEPILKDTYGCIVFQEQVMEIAKSLAGFSPGQADSLRKAMSKKVPEELERLRDDFIKGTLKNKISPKIANKIYDQLVKFGGYGFNKSHSAAYGLVAYQTAYLKANYPLEFMCAVATSEIGHSAIGVADKENKLVAYLDDAKSMGIDVRPPDVSESQPIFSIEEPNAIRFGLVAIKNVGRGAADSIVAARESGPFKNLFDFCARVDLKTTNKKVLESLIKAGAMDSLEPGAPVAEGRARLLSGLDEAVGHLAGVKEDMAKGQGLLFSADSTPPPGPSEGDQGVKPLTEHDLLKYEKEVLGFYVSGHPLLSVKHQLRCAATHPISELKAEITTPVRLAGVLNQVKKMVTKKTGEQMAKGVLEDLTGEINILIFPKTYAAGIGEKLQAGSMVMIEGRLSFNNAGQEGTPELIVKDIMPLDVAVMRYAKKLRLSCKNAALEDHILEALGRAFEAHPGKCPVVLEHETPEGLALLEVDRRVRLDKNLLDSMEKILGEKSWRIENAS